MAVVVTTTPAPAPKGKNRQMQMRVGKCKQVNAATVGKWQVNMNESRQMRARK